MPDAATAPPHPNPTFVDVEIGPYSLSVSTVFGPRVVSLRWHQGPELFAQLGDDAAIPYPGSGTYKFHGGHRLWAAPEIPAITYAPDDHPCAVTTGADGVTIRASVDHAGLSKDVSIGLEGDRLLADPRLSWRERAAVVEARPGPRFKIGSGPDPGRIGYLIDNQLFTKEIGAAGGGTFADRGAVGQVFVDDSFCELESLGPVVSLEPGSSVSHREVWEVTECPDLATAYERVIGRPDR